MGDQWCFFWRPDAAYVRIVELEVCKGSIGKLRIAEDHNDWQHLRVLQLLMSTDSGAETSGNPRVEASPVPEATAEATPLSPIPEGSQETDEASDSISNASAYLQHTEKKWQDEIEKIREKLERIVEENGENQKVNDTESDQRMPLSLLTAAAETVILGPPLECNDLEVDVGGVPAYDQHSKA